MRPAEILFFLPLAAAVHVGVWSFVPVSLGASSVGGAGSAQVTLTSAAAPYNALVRSWQTAPQTALEVVQPRLATTRPGQLVSNALPPGLALSRLPSVMSATLSMAKPPPLPSLQMLEPLAPIRPYSDTSAPRRLSDPKLQQALLSQPQAMRPDTAAQADTRAPIARVKPDAKPKLKITEPPSARVPVQSAVGGVTTKPGQSGQSGQDAMQSENTAVRDSLRARWGAKIQRRVHRRLIYPRGATGTGVAQVALTISKSGKLTRLRLTRSSGVAAFDQAALRAVRRARQFPKAPGELLDQSYSFILSLSFRSALLHKSGQRD